MTTVTVYRRGPRPRRQGTTVVPVGTTPRSPDTLYVLPGKRRGKIQRARALDGTPLPPPFWKVGGGLTTDRP